MTTIMWFIDNSSSACCNEVDDELIAMEEKSCSINLDLPNFTDDKLSRAIGRVQSFLDNRPLYLQICKNEFAALLLKALGPSKLTSSIVNDLFNEIDVDNDGQLSVEEIASYMLKIEQQSKKEKFTFFYDRLVRASYLGTFSFVCACTMSIAKNVFVRFYGDGYTFTSVAYELSVWLSFIGGIFFLVSVIYNARALLHGAKLSNSAKFRQLASFFLAIDQLVSAFWLLGAAAYVAEMWLFGGLSYFLGGILSFISLYKSTLDELVQNHTLIRKLRASFPEMEHSSIIRHVPRILDNERSVDSDLSVSELGSKDEMDIDSPEINHNRHKRTGTYSNIICIVDDSRDQGHKVRHRRSLTCPRDFFRSPSAGTPQTEPLSDTGTTKSINSDSPLIVSLGDDVVKENHHHQPFAKSTEISNTFLGRDIDVRTKHKSNRPLHCYDAFISLSNSNSGLDQSFRLVSSLSQSNVIDVHQLASEKTMNDFWQMAFWKQFESLTFYIATLNTLGGLMFTVGASKPFPQSVLEDLYVTGSTLFLCGCALILFRVKVNASDEWNLLQQSRMALHALISDGRDEV